MQLISCHIENFGKLSSFDMSFSDGLNEIMNANGWGKTTLAAFIKVMLYGFDNEGKRAVEKERDKYRPWQGGEYGGKLTFKTEGKAYTICRTFGKNAKDDEFKLLDAVTGMETEEFATDVGQELLHIDRDTFFNTLFISQNDRSVHATDDMHARMGSQDDIIGDISGYLDVEKHIEDMLNKATPSRKTGSLNRLKAEISELEQEQSKRDGLEKSIDEYQEKLKQQRAENEALCEEKKLLQDMRGKVSSYEAGLVKKKRYEELLGENERRGQELEHASEAFCGKRPTREDCSSLKKKASEYTRESEAEKNKRLSEDESKKLRDLEKGLRGYWKLFASIVLVIVGVLMGLLLNTASVVVVVDFVVLVLIVQQKNDRASYNLLYKKKQESDEAVAVKEKAWEELKTTFEEFSLTPETDLDDQISTLYENVLTYERCEAEAKQAKNRLEAFTAQEDVNALVNITAPETDKTATELDEEVSALEEQTASTRDIIRNYEVALEEKAGEIDELDANAAEIEEKKEKYDCGMEKYEVLKLTKEYLEKAKNGLTARYTEPFQNSLEKNYEILSNGEESHYTVDVQMNVGLNIGSMPRKIDSLSRGYLDLSWMCMRMSFIDAMYPEDKPFIIMDDPFVNMDEKKIQGGRKLIKELAKEYQILYFTCHESRQMSE